MEKLHEPPALRGTLPCGVRTFLPPNALSLSRRPFDLPDGILARISRQVATETAKDCLLSLLRNPYIAKSSVFSNPARTPSRSKSGPRSDTNDDEGPRSVTALPNRHGLRPGKPAPAPSRSESIGRRATRERGRPARMRSRSVPLSYPAMRRPATLPAGTPWVRPKQSSGAVAGRAGWRKWPRPCQCCAGRTPVLPGGRQGAGRINRARRRAEFASADRHRPSPAEAGIVATAPAPATARLKAAFFRAGTGRTTGG